jgi:tetratricopeptide (TPR) repeat protein
LDEAARAADASDDGARAESHEALGNALYARFELDGADADQHAAVEHLRIALGLLPADDVDVVTYSSNLATALLGRFELIDSHRAELDEAVALLDVALKAAGGEEAAPGELLSNVGNGLRLRAVADGSVDEVDRAVGLLARAVEVEAESPRRAGLLGNLAGGLLERYDLTGRIADVDEAIAALDESLSLTPADDANRPSRLNNLGIALRTRALRRHEAGREDLDRAVAAFEDALALTPAQAPDAAALHANLGNVLHQRHDVTRHPEDIARAVRELEAALERTPEGSADRPGYLNNLAATLSARAAEPHGAGGDLERAVGAASEAVRLCPPESARRATFLVNLGNTLAERYDRSRALDDLFAAREAYRSAAETGLFAGPADAFAAARNWSEWARDRREWKEVADAYAYGEQATGALVRAQLLRADKESWLRDVEGLITDGAFALVACSRPREAAVALERGRALLLSEALEREQADLSRLEANRTELAARFRRSAAGVRKLELSGPRGSPRRSGVSIAATSGRPP